MVRFQTSFLNFYCEARIPSIPRVTQGVRGQASVRARVQEKKRKKKREGNARRVERILVIRHRLDILRGEGAELLSALCI